MAALTDAEAAAFLASLRAAYFSGTRSVSYDGKSATFESSAQMLAKINQLESQLGLERTGGPRRTVATHSRGFY